MTIKIYRGPGGDNSPFVSFVGVSSDSSSAASRLNYVGFISAQVADDADKVNIVNLAATDNSPYTVYEITDVHYTDWRDDSGNSFASALDVVAHINNFSYDYDSGFDILEPRIAGVTTDIHTLNSGTSYSLKYDPVGATQHYWDPAGLPPGMDISAYDNRKIVGTPTTPGSYTVDLEVANSLGNVSARQIQITVL